MIAPARAPRDDERSTRLLVSDHGETLVGSIVDLPKHLRRGDVVVVNDAMTLPASLRATGPHGQAVELRLLGVDLATGAITGVLLGEGDHTTRTEHRALPPDVDTLTIGDGVTLRRFSVDPKRMRLVTFVATTKGDPLARALWSHGRPIQYAHVAAPLALWAVQTPYASRPWAIEMPSAGRPLTWEVLLGLRARGVEIARLTHAAGISSTGDVAIDASLPLPERYDLPRETISAIDRARRSQGRVVAVGTSVVRALEDSFAKHGQLREGEALATLKLGPRTARHVVDALLTGMHERGTSHWALLEAFASDAALTAAHAIADRAGFLGHELGDVMLLFGERRVAQRAA
ncbi:MAG: S-adenosylmethionine:tRNA ribosyltransferase-isomerase [Polyangiales bacterium]